MYSMYEIHVPRLWIEAPLSPRCFLFLIKENVACLACQPWTSTLLYTRTSFQYLLHDVYLRTRIHYWFMREDAFLSIVFPEWCVRWGGPAAWRSCSTGLNVTLFILVYVKTTICATEDILGKCPTWRTNSFQRTYLFIILYMFQARRAHHQERQIVLIQLLVTVTPCWWQCRVLVGSLQWFLAIVQLDAQILSPTRSDSYQKLYWYNLFLLMMSMTCSKHVENYK